MNILLTVIVGFIGYKIALKLKAPAPAMIGSMLAVGLTNVIFDYAYMPYIVKNFTQVITGAFIGVQVKKHDLLQLKAIYKPAILLVVILTVNTFLIGSIMHFIFKIDYATALLSCVAGGITDLSLISMDMNADTATVALLQLVRLVTTLTLFPIFIQYMCKDIDERNANEKVIVDKIENGLNRLLNRICDKGYKKVIFTIAFAGIFGYIGYILHFPSGVLVMAMFSTAFLNCFSDITYIPKDLKFYAQIFAGALVGCNMTRSALSGLGSLIIPAILLVGSYFLVNIIYAGICRRFKLIDYKSACFSACPAGVSDMALIASELGADLKTTAVIHVVRLIYAVGVMPSVISIFMNIIGG